MFSVDSWQFTSGPLRGNYIGMMPASSIFCASFLNKWPTWSELTAVYWKHLSPAGAVPPHPVRIRHSPNSFSPNSFSPMAEITPTTLESLRVVEGTRQSENLMQSLRFIISDNISVSLAAAQWMNKDRKHVEKRLKKTFTLTDAPTTLQPCWWPIFRKTCTFNSALGEIEA